MKKKVGEFAKCKIVGEFSNATPDRSAKKADFGSEAQRGELVKCRTIEFQPKRLPEEDTMENEVLEISFKVSDAAEAEECANELTQNIQQVTDQDEVKIDRKKEPMAAAIGTTLVCMFAGAIGAALVKAIDLYITYRLTKHIQEQKLRGQHIKLEIIKSQIELEEIRQNNEDFVKVRVRDGEELLFGKVSPQLFPKLQEMIERKKSN